METTLTYSPWLGIVTAIFELTTASWVMRSPGRVHVLRPVAAILVLLAGYQLIEVFVCRDPTDLLLARLAFANIVWLPPLGVWLLLQLTAPKKRWSRKLGYAFFAGAAVFSVWPFADPDFVTRSVCQVFFAKYHNPSRWYELYGAFYHAGLWTMMFGGVWALVVVEDPVQRRHIGDLVSGTIGFVVPALLTEVIFRPSLGGMPSVMCHYAIVLAVFLTRLAYRERQYAQRLVHAD